MTDSASPPAPARATGTQPQPGKRERLVSAATQLLHQQGIERTTLADIAKAADVPAGNVYYYFKTKDEVIGAVIDAHARQIEATLGLIDARHRSPKSRLKAFVAEVTAQGEPVARHGCPLGSLCSELGKRIEQSSLGEATLMCLPIQWAEEQFRSLGRPDAHDLAVDLMAAYEGGALLANTLRDANVLSRTGRRLDRWIESL